MGDETAVTRSVTLGVATANMCVDTMEVYMP